MKRKIYEIPTMKVVQLKHKAQLLVGSVGASRSGYETAGTQTWGDED